jgi:RNA polymerase sigma-70 factor (ECF subfamily)
MPDPDPELIQRARDGDRDSLKALLREVEPAVRQWARSHAGDSDSASDLSQEVLLLMIRKIGSYRGDARFLSWLFAVTRNQAVEHTRRNARHRTKMNRLKREIAQTRHASNPAEERLDQGRIREVVHAFVQELPRRQREVFQMSELQGLSSPEIGGILDLRPVSVRAALLKARRALRKKIMESHPELMEEYLP